jgi:hypothetical protein
VTSRDESFLSHTLEVLRPQCEALNAECIVVDSSLGRLQAIADANPWVRWIDYVPQIPKSRTVPHQRNVGCLAARSPIIAFCDAGGEPDPAWLAQLVAPLLAGEAQATAGPIRPLRPGTYPVFFNEPSGTRVSPVITANFASLRETFLGAGGFDERYTYTADTDFGWRLAELGVSVLLVPTAIMTVDWGSTRRHLRRQILSGQGIAQQLVFLPPLRKTVIWQTMGLRAIFVLLFLLTLLIALTVINLYVGLLGLLATLAVTSVSLISAGTRFDSNFTHGTRMVFYRLIFLWGFLRELLSPRPYRLRAQPRNTGLPS